MKKKLVENPDSIWTETGKMDFSNPDAYAFGMYKGKVYVSTSGGTHPDIDSRYPDVKLPNNRLHYKYPGRLWFSRKVISFWEYPPKNAMRTFIKLIEKELNIKILNNGYFIEIVDDNGKYVAPALDPEALAKYDTTYWDVDTVLIPLEDYTGSGEQKNKGQAHAISPLLKKGKPIPSGVGSKRYGKKMPLAYRQKLRQENINESSNNNTTKPIGKPRGKAPYMPTDGINDRPKSWEAKLIYWRKMIEKMIGYEVIE